MEEPDYRDQWAHLALFASVSTAAEVTTTIRDRLSGRDPSAQEPNGAALSYLSDAVPEIRQVLFRLRTLLLGRRDRDDGPSSALMRFPELMLLLRASRLLHRIHQRLLSLYPAVSEEQVEEVRVLELMAGRMLRGRTGDFEGHAFAFVERGLAFTDQGIRPGRRDLHARDGG